MAVCPVSAALQFDLGLVLGRYASVMPRESQAALSMLARRAAERLRALQAGL